MKRLLASGLALLLFGNTASLADADLDAAFPQSSIVITASRMACYRFDVYLAMNDAQWQRGLMHVRSLDAWRGMLFVYARDGRRSMWMKNTFLPLDMLFIKADGRISSIVSDTEPQSLRSITSVEAVRYVLELNAGVTARLDIKAGNAVLWAGDVSPPSQD